MAIGDGDGDDKIHTICVSFPCLFKNEYRCEFDENGCAMAHGDGDGPYLAFSRSCERKCGSLGPKR